MSVFLERFGEIDIGGAYKCSLSNLIYIHDVLMSAFGCDYQLDEELQHTVKPINKPQRLDETSSEGLSSAPITIGQGAACGAFVGTLMKTLGQVNLHGN